MSWYIGVDWSAASKPILGANSIWMSILGDHDSHGFTANISTRGEFRRILGNFLRTQMGLGQRAYLGVDFALSYPADYQRDLIGALESPRENALANATREHISALVVDEGNNTNNRFEVAASLNRAVGYRSFWGRPTGLALPSELEPWLDCHVENTPITRHRACEQVARTYSGGYISSVFQLYGAGAVGSQSLLGLALLHGLANDLRIAFQYWPEDTSDGAVTVIETWPTLFRHEVDSPDLPSDLSRDERDARAIALWLKRYVHDYTTEYARLSLEQRFSQRFPASEGWIAGVPFPYVRKELSFGRSGKISPRRQETV